MPRLKLDPLSQWVYTYYWTYTLEYGDPIWVGNGGCWKLPLTLVR